MSAHQTNTTSSSKKPTDQEGRARRRSMLVAGGIIVLLIVAVIIGLLVRAHVSASSEASPSSSATVSASPSSTSADSSSSASDTAIQLSPEPVGAPTPDTDDTVIGVGSVDAPVVISIYQDYRCPYCGIFERTNSADLESVVADGTARVELHLMNFLDKKIDGQYSTRAANAAFTVAQQDPDHMLAFNAALYENQPEESGTGLTDDQIAQLAQSVGVSESITSTFADLSNSDLVTRAEAAAVADGISGTPTVKINGATASGNGLFTTGGNLKSAVEQVAAEQSSGK